MEWFPLLIPIIISLFLLGFFKKEVTWWELAAPIAVTTLFILIFKFSVKTVMIKDDEYWGYLVKEARYYEYWETYVEQTCSYTTTCCCDSKGNNCQTEVHYYDCSYCDENQPYWKAYDEGGNSFRISESYYKYLKDKWQATPQFVELNRHINYENHCGKDGDAYRINWNGKIESSEASVTEHTYTNKVQASHSAFKLPYVSKERAKSLGLYDYPDDYSYYKQKVVLGLDSIYDKASVEKYETKFQYFNGYHGAKNKVKLFILLFYDKPIGLSFDQEAYWDGGNQNELVVCIGLNRSNKTINWVRPFSWTDKKRVLVDCREDIANLRTFNPDGVYDAIEHAVSSNDIHKDFNKDFDYLTIDLPNWALTVCYIVALVLSLGIGIWSIGNEFENDSIEEDVDEERGPRSRYDYYESDNVWDNFVNRCKHEFKKMKKAWNQKK